MCPVGMDAAGFKDSGRWDGMSYRVEFSLSAALVAAAAAASQPLSLFTAFEQTFFPVLRATALSVLD